MTLAVKNLLLLCLIWGDDIDYNETGACLVIWVVDAFLAILVYNQSSIPISRKDSEVYRAIRPSISVI